MKRTHCFIGGLIIVASLLMGCTESNDTVSELLPELVQAEAVMYEHPDSALHILQKIAPAGSQELQHATWALLLTQAKYKMYIKQTDSLLTIASNFFMKKDDPQRKALVLYCQSGLYGENNEIEKEQELLLQASNEVEKTEDYQLGFLIYSSLANRYVYRSLHNYALQAAEKAQQYALKSNNKDYIILSLMFLGRVYSTQNQYQKSIFSYQKSIKLSENTCNKKNLIRTMKELAAIYARTKEYKPAISLLKKGIELSLKEKALDSLQYFLILGDIYRQINRVDSAYYFLNKALFSENIHTLGATYQSLYYLNQREQKYQEAIKCSDKLLFYQDSIQKLDKSRDLTEMQEKYNQQKVINEKNQAKIENDKKIRTILILLIVLICAIAIIIYLYQRKLIRKEKIIQENEEKIRNSTHRIQDNEIQIARNRSRMEELTAEMEANKDVQEHLEEQSKALLQMQKQNELLVKENQGLQENISRYTYFLDKVNKEISNQKKMAEEYEFMRERERFLCSLLVKKTDELNKLRTSPKYLSDVQWEEVITCINYMFNNFTERLHKQIPSLTESDLQICCLIKLHIPNQDIATLTGIEPTSVSKRKQRLKERIIQINGPLEEGQTLDIWLWDF